MERRTFLTGSAAAAVGLSSRPAASQSPPTPVYRPRSRCRQPQPCPRPPEEFVDADDILVVSSPPSRDLWGTCSHLRCHETVINCSSMVPTRPPGLRPAMSGRWGAY
jgi:hypothetical protein